MKGRSSVPVAFALCAFSVFLTSCQGGTTSSEVVPPEIAPTIDELPPEFKGWQTESKEIIKRIIESKALSASDRQFIVDRLNGSTLEEWSLAGPILMAYARSSAANSLDAQDLYNKHVTEKHQAEAPEYFKVLKDQISAP